MKKIVKLFFLVLLLIPIILFGRWGASKVFAEACQDKTDLSERISCYQDEIAKLSSQSKTLSNQIAQFDAQIRLATLKISQTEEQITLLGGRIDRLEGSLDALTQAYSSRTVETYKMIRVGDPILILISAPDLNEAVARFNYLKKIQESDRDLLDRLQTAQTSYKGQKTDQEQLQTQLTAQKVNLNNQKAAKAALLAVTKNSEKTYQALLSQALTEKGAIKSAISHALELLKNGGGEPISAGDTVGLLGNSGAPDCSTGAHLHFSVLKDSNIQNPADYLKNTSVVWENQPDGSFGFLGDWDWPITNPTITQGYGMSYWARLGWYGGSIHDGIDMTSDTSNVIKAPKAGKIIRGATTCDNSTVPGVSTLKYAAIAHDGGIITIYLHIQ